MSPINNNLTIHPTAHPTARFLTITQCIECGILERTLYKWIKAGRVRKRVGPKAKNGKRQTLIDPVTLRIALVRAGKEEIAKKVLDYIVEAAKARIETKNHDEDREIDTENLAAPIGADHDEIAERIDRFEDALGRYSRPEEKEAARRRCLDLESLVIEYRELAASAPIRSKKHPKGSPKALRICRRAKSIDPVWLGMYPRENRAPSLYTFEKWVRAYNKEGKAGFLRDLPALKPEKDQRFHQIPQAAADWLLANLRNYTADKKVLVTHLGKAWIQIGKREGWNLPWTTWGSTSRNSCYSYLRRWIRANIADLTGLLLTEGERKLKQTVAAVRRNYDDLRPWEAWTSDWRPFDVIVNRRGVLLRLNLCPIVDIASRAVIGFCIADKPNSAGVRYAILDAIKQSKWKAQQPGLENIMCGLPVTYDPKRPAFIHFDNGKDFRSYSVEGQRRKIKVRLEEQTALFAKSCKIGLVDEVNLAVRHSRPFSPRAKLAEWFYTYIARWEKVLPGYCGHKIGDKPHWLPAAFRIHNKLVKRQQPKGADVAQLPPSWVEYLEKSGSVFPIECDFNDWFCARLIEYLNEPQPGLADHMGYMSPVAYLKSNPHRIEMPSDWALASMLMDRREVTVRYGELKVTWGTGERWSYWEPEDSTALAELPHKTKVEFRYDPADLGRGWVFRDGRFLVMVEQNMLLSHRASADDVKRAVKYQKSRVTFAKNQLAEFESRGKAELIAVSLERAEREAEMTAIAIGDRRQTKPVTRITRFDKVPKSQRKSKLEVVRQDPIELFEDEINDESETMHKPEPEWIEPWEED